MFLTKYDLGRKIFHRKKNYNIGLKFIKSKYCLEIENVETKNNKIGFAINR